MENGSVIKIKWLSRWFKNTQALRRVNLDVGPGQVFGLVGENGAGKTTLLKHIMGLLKVQEGELSVFGMDPIKNPEEVLVRIGYLSENRDLPDWMKVHELIRYMRAFYPDWDDAYVSELIGKFGLDINTRIKDLSRGQRAQAGLLVALAHHPDLLVLDEPSSGLDAVVRQDILMSIVRTVAEEGRTVLFSSHLLDEVERIADTVAIIDNGAIALCEPLDDLKENHQIVSLRFDEERSAPPSIAGVLHWQGQGRDWTATTQARCTFEDLDAAIIEQRPAKLEEIFVARVRAKRAQSTT